MTGRSHSRRFLTRCVVAAVTPATTQLTQALERRWQRMLGAVPEHCCLVQPGVDLPGQLSEALASVLSIRNAINRPVAASAEDASGASPVVLLAVAAADLGDCECLETACRAIRREFRRSCISGRLGLLLYAGAVERRLPEADILRQLEHFVGVDFALIFSDRDGAGRHVGIADAMDAAALFLFYYLAAGAVATLLDDSLAQGGPTPLPQAIGVCRLDLSERGVQRILRRQLRSRLCDQLFAAVETPVESLECTRHLTAETLRRAFRDSGSLAAVAQAAESPSRRAAIQLRQALLVESAERTEQALRALLPPARPPVPRTGLVARLLAWLRRIWLRLRRRPAGPPVVIAPLASPARSPASADAAGWLIETDRLRLLTAQMAAALRSRPRQETQAGDCPFDISVCNHPLVRQTLEPYLTEGLQVLGRLLQAESPAELLADAGHPQRLRSRLDRLCRQALKLDLRRHLLKQADYRGVIGAVAGLVSPLCPGGNELPRQLALRPRELGELQELPQYRTAVGWDDEIVLVTIQAVNGLDRLSGEEEGHDERGHAADAADTDSAS